ncbi:hypothetical protein [Paenibacillus senegalensis]|uniref:hypothetical protein n=1 Tax=Paenibacillus senegalensis TaxID=1465766 RepID=UPI000288A169|nr:hypothetical protein [Paenibacillus senegalensis]
MKFRLAIVGLAALLLSACGYSLSSTSEMDYQHPVAGKTVPGDESAQTEPSKNKHNAAANVESPSTLESTAVESGALSDEGSADSSLQETDIEAQLNVWTMEEWEDTPLSKEEFNELLTEMIKGDEETNPFSEITLLDDYTLKVVFNNTDGESLENMLFAPIFDGVLRSLYMRSSYYQNEQQPVIQFVDSSGKLIAENTNFANLEQP